jgi:hypothetical protein
MAGDIAAARSNSRSLVPVMPGGAVVDPMVSGAHEDVAECSPEGQRHVPCNSKYHFAVSRHGLNRSLLRCDSLGMFTILDIIGSSQCQH